MTTDGSPSITLRDIAESAGVSIGTVSLALNDGKGISEATRQRIIQVARSMGYDRFNRKAAKNGSQTISVLIEHLPIDPTSDPFNKMVLLGLETAARAVGYRIALEFVNSNQSALEERWVPDTTAGIVILGGGDIDSIWVKAIIESQIPVVMVDHFIHGIDLPTIIPDNFAGAYSMTRYLIEKGHKRIGFIRGPSKYWTLSERLAGYMLAMQQAGLGPDSDLIPPRISSGLEKGYGEMLRLLELAEPPTAVFAVSDKTAVGVYKALQEKELRIPGDISVAGFDDTEIARVLHPALTTVRNPGEIMGQVAFERLLSCIENGNQAPSSTLKWTVPTQLVLRESVRDI